jgi:hypothetical protein
MPKIKLKETQLDSIVVTQLWRELKRGIHDENSKKAILTVLEWYGQDVGKVEVETAAPEPEDARHDFSELNAKFNALSLRLAVFENKEARKEAVPKSTPMNQRDDWFIRDYNYPYCGVALTSSKIDADDFIQPQFLTESVNAPSPKTIEITEPKFVYPAMRLY